MVALERQTESTLGQLLDELTAYPKTAEAVKRFHGMVRRQREALEGRLASIIGREHSSPKTAAVGPLTPVLEVRRTAGAQASSAMHSLYTVFNHAALGYAILHAVAHRFFDSQDQGNTADLAEAHLRNYAAAAQEISQLISDVVVRELGEAGQECQCLCPACSLGVCVCAPHGTNTVNQAWRETSPTALERGLLVRAPRVNSAAARAGLREGDRIIAVDDQEISSDLDTQSMQSAIRRHQPGDKIRLQLDRGAGEFLELSVARP